MFEVIYISLSCKQAERFIIDISEKLKFLRITDFEVDRKNLRLKTNKAIVSAVDIWSGQLGRSHHITKYYIDDIEGYILSYNAHERVRLLKRTFRENAQKITEDELIKILTER